MAAALFDEIIGQARAIEILQRAVVAGAEPDGSQALVQSWLFTGPPGDRKSTRLNSSHIPLSRMPSSA